jgi:hypothetical protein
MFPSTHPDLYNDINLISTFLSHAQIPSLSTHQPSDVLIICASSVLHQTTQVFKTLQSRPQLAKTLVLVGGIGHSTSLIYDAVARHPTYHKTHDKIVGLPEADVLYQILTHYFDIKTPEDGCPQILIENRSTNCGANAVETRKILDKAKITGPLSSIIVQDPTMSLRTLASFEKAYSDLPLHLRPTFKACPVFVPRVEMRDTSIRDGRIEFVVDSEAEDGLRTEDLWEMRRFCELLVGEVARLRDDESGYGPAGKGFIGHVDVSEEVFRAAERVREGTGFER